MSGKLAGSGGSKLATTGSVPVPDVLVKLAFQLVKAVFISASDVQAGTLTVEQLASGGTAPTFNDVIPPRSFNWAVDECELFVLVHTVAKCPHFASTPIIWVRLMAPSAYWSIA